MPYAGFSGPIPRSTSRWSRSRSGSLSGRQADSAATPVFTILPRDSTTRSRACSSAETSGIREPPDIGYETCPTPNRHRVPRRSAGNGLPRYGLRSVRLSQAVYRPLFEEDGARLFDIGFPGTAEICATPGGAAVFRAGTTPVPLSAADRARATRFMTVGRSRSDAFEQSVQVSAFSSKFDAFLAGKYKLTTDEMAGYQAVLRWQGQLQFMPPRRKRNHSEIGGRPTPAPKPW